MVGTGRNDPNFYLELVGGLSQRLVLDFGLVRDLLHGCSSSIGTAKTDHLAVDLAPTALSAWRSFRCPVGSADRRARRLRELGPGTQEQSGEALSLIESWAGAEAVIVVDAVVSGKARGEITVWDARAHPVSSSLWRGSTIILASPRRWNWRESSTGFRPASGSTASKEGSLSKVAAPRPR